MATKPERGTRLRWQAAQAISAVVHRGTTLDRALEKHLHSFDGRDHALGVEIVSGSVRWYSLLVYVLKQLRDSSKRRPAPELESLVVCGLYQLSQMRVPDHAAVAATVGALAHGRHRHARGFANAVLRRYLREREAIEARLVDRDRLAHPQWLSNQLDTDWPDAASSIISANNQRAPMWLRVNRRRLDRERYRQKLATTHPDIDVEAPPWLPDALRLATPIPIAVLPGFAAGDVSVQDGGAQVAALLLAPVAGERILDACAAPGNKTGYLAEIGGPALELTAIDADSARLASLSTNLARTGVSATVDCADACMTDTWWDGQPFDRILVDAPCSGSGVIRRHPDIKFTRRASDIAPLAAIQARLLDSLWPTLKPGGRLLYVTCSVLREENERVVRTFVDTHPDAHIWRQLPDVAIQALMTPCDLGFQWLPGRHNCDGFFYACLEKST
ncbi:MAG: 16S rRNA (cytosine(967)-C(5))-methyltransferase RsmB [Pseudomonadota bacterium]